MSLRAALTFREPHKAEPYADAMRQSGIEPVLISPDLARDLSGLAGLVLSGGTDLDPALYGASAQPEDEPPDGERDELEIRLLRQALERDLPVLAICRGLQLFNVAHGGTLIQHLQNTAVHAVRGDDASLPVHSVRVEAGTRLAEILGAGEHAVNSRHHQAVARLGKDLKISAKSLPDGVIEGLERDDRRFAVAVQWHPEDQVKRDLEQRKLFTAFAQALG